MGLIERLRNVGQRAGNAAHVGIARVRSTFEDAEGRLRQRMRVYPQRPKLWGTAAGEMGAAVDEQLEDETFITTSPEAQPQQSPRAPIVSVNGRDIDEKDLGRGSAA
jgi:hypothetical protein